MSDRVILWFWIREVRVRRLRLFHRRVIVEKVKEKYANGIKLTFIRIRPDLLVFSFLLFSVFTIGCRRWSLNFPPVTVILGMRGIRVKK